MIVTKDTCQGAYAEKYGVGVAIRDCDNLANDLHAFLSQNFDAYRMRCDDLLRKFLNDQNLFVEAVKKFVS